MDSSSLILEDFSYIISEHLPDMLCIRDLEENYIFQNRSTRELLEMIEQNKGDIFFTLKSQERYFDNEKIYTFNDLCAKSDKIALSELKPIFFELCCNLRDELIYFSVRKAPIFTRDGVLIGVIGNARDITLQKKVQSNLISIENLVNSGPVVLFEWEADDGWSIKSASKNVKSLLGISQNDILKSKIPFSRFIHPDDLKRIEAEVYGYITTHTKTFSHSYRLINSDSEVVWVDDYTIVDYNEDGGVKTIKGYLIDSSAKIKVELELNRLSQIDTLTNLPNRNKIQINLKNREPKACIVLNIDKFREINDFFGANAGDSILQQVGKWFANIDETYRIGGDEFAMLIYKNMSRSEISFFVEDILERFAMATFFIEKEQIPVRLNVGISMNSDKLLTQADIALHEAKDKRLLYAFYEEKSNIEETYRSNLMIAANVHSAILQDRVVCHFQPIMDFKTGQIHKYEALVRILCEDGSIMPPISFLPIAKKTKLYNKITQIVIDKACAEFKNKKEEFSINISIDDIKDAQTIQHIINTIIKTDTASRVVFEILESEGIENYNIVEHFIKQVKSLGAKIAIDDFGSGYSNFEHLLRLDIDYIKIDGTLIKEVAVNKNSKIIISTIVDFAKKIDAKTVAEFVSGEDIFNILKPLGVDFAQGYFIGKPEPL